MAEIITNKYTQIITIEASASVQFALEPLSRTMTGRIEIQARRIKDGVYVGNLDRSSRNLYGLFNNVCIDAIHVLDGETLELWGIYRGIPPLEPVILNAAIVNLEVTEPNEEEEDMAGIIQYDPNWGIQMAEFHSSLHWISYITGQHQVGSITFGMVRLKKWLYLALSGHATTEQILEILVDGNPIVTRTGNDFLQGGFRGSPFPTATNTSSHEGQLATIRLTDNHSGGNGWMGVNWGSLLLGDQ